MSKNIKELKDIEQTYKPTQQNNRFDNDQNNKIGYYCQQMFPDYKAKSFTTFNLMLCSLLYIISLLLYKYQDKSWLCILHFMGSHYGPDIGQQYQYYRLITSLFLHFNIQHILFNSFGIAFFGYSLESYYGMRKYICIYFGCGIGGNLISTLWKYMNFSIGASTSLFGIMVWMVFYYMERKHEIGIDRRNALLASMGIQIFLNIIQTFSQKNIDIGAHVGGFIYGLLFSILIYKTQNPIQKKLQILTIIILIIGTGLLIYFINYHKEGPEFYLYEKYNICKKPENEENDNWFFRTNDEDIEKKFNK